MSTSKKTTHLTIRISPEELQEVKDFAASQGMSFTDFVLEALAEKMGKENDRDKRLTALERAVFQSQVA
ncbi:MAG: hypothetical protein KME57_34630 [Scytonema hyalinum WJT4-NPBG1]|jgi:predicted DNA binding CopG/RHH family protein|nr:hypothetical protein [Scytonema hyalinum WJT4-NPBG1]